MFFSVLQANLPPTLRSWQTWTSMYEIVKYVRLNVVEKSDIFFFKQIAQDSTINNLLARK